MRGEFLESQGLIAMPLTPDQEKIGKENFSNAVGVSRREFLAGVGAGAGGLGAAYFGYKELQGAGRQPRQSRFHRHG
ncbi:twin-arginine translocation signal domain-containing protein [Caulifigura coniformis]|uniref:twin-arginine translocation signal domain-containing protein n=1 Tax=Caulifigura coniformis TaxID=2527983 RepID=UPI0028F4605D|nr:twin-arginine translocation signal domain-containing protein [Caulifigura coniformis]